MEITPDGSVPNESTLPIAERPKDAPSTDVYLLSDDERKVFEAELSKGIPDFKRDSLSGHCVQIIGESESKREMVSKGLTDQLLLVARSDADRFGGLGVSSRGILIGSEVKSDKAAGILFYAHSNSSLSASDVDQKVDALCAVTNTLLEQLDSPYRV